MIIKKKRASEVLRQSIGTIHFGMFLRSARIALELTQSGMAECLGITKSMVCDIEKGRQLVSPLLARKIAKKAGLSEKLAIKLALQDQLNKAKILYQVTLKEVA